MSDRHIVSIDADHDAGIDPTEQAIRDAGGTVLRTLAPGEDYRQVVADVGDELADDLRERPEVRYVERDHEAAAVADSGGEDENDASTQDQQTPWGIERVNATVLHEQGVTGAGVPVSVVDSGVAAAHPDLPVEGGRDHIGDTNRVAPPDWDDPNDHGTHCGGTLAAAHNDTGVLGGAPDATLWADRVLGEDGRGSYADIAAGITAGAEAGCRVCSCSLGGSNPSRALEDALAFAHERGAVVVCAAGNDGADRVGYPARYEDAVGVGASTRDDTVADFSNRGAGVDLVAPGKGIVSTVPGGYADGWQGTSMATPLISACVALLVGEGHEPQRALTALTATARTIDAPDEAQGAGLADVAAAHEQLAADGGAPDENVLVVNGEGGGTEYRIGVFGTPEPAGDYGGVNTEDAIEAADDGEDFDYYLRGAVAGGTDAYAGWRRVHHVSFSDPDGAALDVYATGAGKWVRDLDITQYGTTPGWEPPSGPGPEPEPEPEPEPDDPGRDPVAEPGNPLDGNTYSPSQTGFNVVERPLYSDADRRVVVDKDTGDDDATGGDDDPVRTLTEAWSRLPLHNQHNFEVVLEDQVHDADGNLFLPATQSNYIKASGRVEMRSRSGDPTKCAIKLTDSPGYFSTGIQGASPLCAFHVEGVEFRDLVQNYGTMYAENCRFLSSADADVAKAIGGYNSWLRCEDCTFVGGSDGAAEYALGLKHNIYADFFECDIETDKAAILLQAGGGHAVDWAQNSVDTQLGWGNKHAEKFIDHVY